MKAVEKRDYLVKEILVPLLKEAGFKKKKTVWWKELEDGYLFVYMKNSQFNSQETGCSFGFQFSASYAADIREKVENQWIYNQRSCIGEGAFLPYLGYLSPNRDSLGYRIDGYRNGQLTNVPLEEICTQIREDFEVRILPSLMQIDNVEAFEKLKEALNKGNATVENVLTAYYAMMQMLCCAESNLPQAIQYHKESGLSAEEVRSHYDWLAIIANNSMWPDNDAASFIEKVLAEAEDK